MHRGVGSTPFAPTGLRKGKPCAGGAVPIAGRLASNNLADPGGNDPGDIRRGLGRRQSPHDGGRRKTLSLACNRRSLEASYRRRDAARFRSLRRRARSWQPAGEIGGGTPRDFGPCGDVLDRDSPLLFRRPDRRYTYLQSVTPPVEECLLTPFHVD